MPARTVATESDAECGFEGREGSEGEAIFDFVEVFYNGSRRHSTIGYMTPTEFELKFIEEKKLREYEAA
jgi:putative transposase